MQRRICGVILAGLLLATSMLSACSKEKTPPTEVLAYVGITMAKPMSEISDIMMKRYNIHLIINQGGSKDLYDSLSTAKVGDLYLPGSQSYRVGNLKDGYLLDDVLVGYNQSAFFVLKGNPKAVRPELSELLRDDIHTVICSPDSGSIGRESRQVLEQAGIYTQVFDRAEYLTTDSRNLNNALRDGDADLILNWRATAFFKENRDVMQVIDLPKTMVTPKKLLLSRLSFSEHPDLAKMIMDFTASEEGQAIFRKYGFVDASGRRDTP